MATWGPTLIVDGKDDAFEYGGGSFSSTLTVHYVYSNVTPGGNDYRCTGIRFQNVTIPQGASITSATLSIYLNWTTGDDANMKIYGNLVADAQDFVDNANIITVAQRPRTTAFTSWVADSIAAGGVGFYNAPDLADVIEEIVGQGTWVSGNDLVLLLIGNTDQTKQIYFYAYEQTPVGTKGPKLEVVYEEVAEAEPTIFFSHNF